MYMYITSGQNFHKFNVSSMLKSTPCELPVESLSGHFSRAQNRIGTCRPSQSLYTPVPLSEGRFMPKQVICYLIRADCRTHLALGGRPG